MTRGATVLFKFKLPYKKQELIEATIKFWQPNNPSAFLPITRNLSQCSGSGDANELYVSLQASETALFLDKYKAKAQLIAKHLSGTFGSRELLITVYPMRDDMIEEELPLPVPDETVDNWIILDGDTIIGGDGQ